MQARPRTVSALAIIAMAASLAVAPGLLTTASARPTAPTAPARTSVTAECAAAQAALASARSSQAQAHRKVVKARKALRKAKKSHSPAKVRKATRVLRKARHRYRARTYDVRVQTVRVGYACSASTSAAHATGTGMKLDLLATASGIVTQALDLTQLKALLDRLLPGVAGQLDAGQLTGLLNGFNSGALSLEDATALLGGSFTPEEIQALVGGGTVDPALLLELAEHIVGQLSGLVAGFPVPGTFDPTDLTGLLQTFAGIFGTLDASQLGSLLNLVLTRTGQDRSAFDTAKLTSLLDAIAPGVSSQFDPAELTAMLAALKGAGLDAGTLSNLLGGQFSAAQIQQVLTGTDTTVLFGNVFANVLAQLATGGGGDLNLPTTLDLDQANTLISTVTGLITTVLGGGGGSGGGGLFCGLLGIGC
jgi:hypothetical protein